MGRLTKLRFGMRSAFGAPALASLAVLAFLLTSPQALSAVDHDAILRDRLNDVRELLDRRQAYRSMLSEKVERFSHRLDKLQAEREAALEALADQQDRARAYERDLDKLIPRLLPRLSLLDQFRKDGARTIAGLVNMERSIELEDRRRSRLAAAKTASIEQMRRASTAVRLLRRTPNTLTARHRDVDFQIPLLAAAVDRLDHRQSQLLRRRDSSIRDLADLAVDIDRLTAEEHRLARNMIARSLEANDRIDAGSDSRGTVLTNRRATSRSTIAAADIRGVALRRVQPVPVARPLDGLGAGGSLMAIRESESGSVWLTSKDQAAAIVVGRASRLRAGAADVAHLDRESDVRRYAEPDSGEALMPTIETIGFGTAGGDGVRRDGLREFQISARPLQEVAAPRDGRVAFAGDFRSYGLLLIIEHGNGYHTLLWGFSSLDAELGDTVRAGQIVGVVKDGPSPKLHVELRRNGQPVSPEVWLAASNSGVKG